MICAAAFIYSTHVSPSFLPVPAGHFLDSPPGILYTPHEVFPMSQMIRTSLDALSDLLSAVGMTRPLYVCSRRWTSRLPDGAPVFSHFEPNPDFDQCAAGVSMFQRKGCDGLVAIG